MTDRHPLYLQIAEAVRQDLLAGRLRPGDALPTVREMAERWKCTPGTVQQAYKELTRQGIAISRPGQGTRIGSAPPAVADPTPLRRAAVTHEAETFLLEMLSAGYTVEEAESGFRAALDRWRAVTAETPSGSRQTLRFVGSHDPAVSLVASRFPAICDSRGEACVMQVRYTGSLGGLIALAEGSADIAGSHLWDEESDTYNAPFVRRLLPGREVALLTLAQRHLGLILREQDAERVARLAHMAQRGVTFINRQRGSGTRVWLEAQLRREGISTRQIVGFELEATTHEAVARAVAEGAATVGLGIQTAALQYGLHFTPLTTETYHLIIPGENWETKPVLALRGWLAAEGGRAAIATLGGYDVSNTGNVTWAE
jgi:molybdate-binding protein/DNA-binding transcriptional regulator YhcF (GntR family)